MTLRPQVQPGEIYWLTDCPPIDGEEVKTRPVLIFALHDTDSSKVLVLPISSSTRDKDRVDIPNSATDPRQTRTTLKNQCWAIPRRLMVTEVSRLGDYAGVISRGRMTQARAAVLTRKDEKD